MTSDKFQLPLTLISFALLAFFVSAADSQPLQLDNSFASGGKLTVPFSAAGLHSSHAYQIFVQPSGRIVVNGGHQVNGSDGQVGVAACGLTTGGTLDSGFGSSGKTLEMNGSFPRALERLPDGKFLRLDLLTAALTRLQRFNVDGSVDNSFSADLNIGGFVSPMLLATRADGKILVLMRTSSAEESLWLVRLNSNGSRDNSFGNNGVSLLRLRKAAAIFAMKILPDNRIVFGGYQSTTGGPQGGNVAWAALTDENGYLDRRFGLQGVFRMPFTHGIRISDLVLQSDGKIVLVGHARAVTDTSRLMLIRINLRGRRDTGFGDGGVAIAANISTGSFDVAHSGAIMSDGRIVLAGSYSVDAFGPTSFLVTRFSTSGVMESNAVTAFTPNQHSVAHDVEIQADGKAVLAGYTKNPDTTSEGNLFAIARYNQ